MDYPTADDWKEFDRVMADLAFDLEMAVSEERYEDAARTRDAIRLMTGRFLLGEWPDPQETKRDTR